MWLGFKKFVENMLGKAACISIFLNQRNCSLNIFFYQHLVSLILENICKQKVKQLSIVWEQFGLLIIPKIILGTHWNHGFIRITSENIARNLQPSPISAGWITVLWILSVGETYLVYLDSTMSWRDNCNSK